MQDIKNQLDETFQDIEKVIVYSAPDGEEFNDFEDFYNYMLNGYELSIKVSMTYDLEDALHYLEAEELFAGENYDDIEDYMDEVTHNWNAYNSDLEEKSGVDVDYVDFDFRGCNYILTGTVNGLLTFCEGQCSHYNLDDAGDSLYTETQALNNFKKRIAELK